MTDFKISMPLTGARLPIRSGVAEFWVSGVGAIPDQVKNPIVGLLVGPGGKKIVVGQTQPAYDPTYPDRWLIWFHVDRPSKVASFTLRVYQSLPAAENKPDAACTRIKFVKAPTLRRQTAGHYLLPLDVPVSSPTMGQTCCDDPFQAQGGYSPNDKSIDLTRTNMTDSSGGMHAPTSCASKGSTWLLSWAKLPDDTYTLNVVGNAGGSVSVSDLELDVSYC